MRHFCAELPKETIYNSWITFRYLRKDLQTIHIHSGDVYIWINLELEWCCPVSRCQAWNKRFNWWLEERQSSYISTLIIDHLLCLERVLTTVLMMFGCATVLHLQLALWVQIYIHSKLTATCLINTPRRSPLSQQREQEQRIQVPSEDLYSSFRAAFHWVR